MGFVLLWVGMVTLVLCMGTGMRLCMCMFMLSNQPRNGVFVLNIEDILRELLVNDPGCSHLMPVPNHNTTLTSTPPRFRGCSRNPNKAHSSIIHINESKNIFYPPIYLYVRIRIVPDLGR